MARATETELELAEHLGFSISQDHEIGHTFHRPRGPFCERNVWPCFRGWQTADLVDSDKYDQIYDNHKMFDSLKDALTRGLSAINTFYQEGNPSSFRYHEYQYPMSGFHVVEDYWVFQFNRVEWDTLRDGKIIAMNAGPNGAKKKARELYEKSKGGTDGRIRH